MSVASGDRLGPYEIVELLGAGGMGEVYRARDVRLGRFVAVKTIRPNALPDAEAMEHLLTEARTAASLNHSNIAQIYDVGEHEGAPYIVMELIEGISLEARLAAGPLPLPELLGVARSVASALGEAHRRRVIHRDIKPTNILLAVGGQVKVLDFGLAKLLPGTDEVAGLAVSSTGVAAGTAPYMSPEQALGDRVSPATDVFSAGVVMYRMAAGTLPFTGNGIFQIIDRILHAEPPTLRRVDLPAALLQVIRRALSKSPADRYANGEALETALAAIQAGEPAPPQRIAIAVLPFEDLSPAGDNEYFGIGLTDEIAAVLSGIGSLAVVSRSLTSRYAGPARDVRTIGTDLGVGFVLHGSIRKSSDALRITVQLIDVRDNASVWAESYSGTLQNVFAIQEELARKIVSALTVKLTPAEQLALKKRSTLDAEAFDLCLRGRRHLDIGTRRDIEAAIASFERAVARDHRYAVAHAGLAGAAAAWYEYYDRSPAWLDRAVESALRALMYDPALAEPYAALAHAYFNRGALEDSRDACRRAIELDPGNWIGYWTLARIYHLTGRGIDAIELLRRVLALNPEFYVGYFTLRMVCQATGNEAIYRPYLARLVDEVFPKYLADNPHDTRARNSYGMELSMAGRMAEGRIQVDQALAEAPDDPMILYATACYESVFGDRRLAVALLQRSVRAGFVNFAYIRQDPDLRPLHGDPDYHAMVGSG